MSRRQSKGDVAWYGSNRKKPIAYSTTATRDLVEALFEQYKDLEVVYQNINYDEEAKRIVKLLLIDSSRARAKGDKGGKQEHC